MNMRFLSALSAFGLIVSATTFAQETKTVISPIFEDSFEAGAKTPKGWKSGARIPGVEYIYDTKTGSTGKRSLSLKKTANRYFPIAQWFQVLPAPESRSIRVTAKVKARKATKAIIEIQFLDQNDRMLGKKWLAYIGAKEDGDKPVSHSWKEYGDSADVLPNTKKILIGLQIYGPGQVWFDDIKITAGEGGNAQTNADAANTAGLTTIKVADVEAQYIFTPPRKPNQTKKHGLLIVMPGGDGSAEFQPFVNRIHENSAEDDIALAQPIAKSLHEGQKIVWLTESEGLEFCTEDMVRAVVRDVSAKVELDPERIFLLAWSSSGPAAYATLLQEDSPISGAIIAMSVFKPDHLGDLKYAANRKFYLLHSPEDRVCPHWMAKNAVDQLSAKGGHVKLVNYEGGHGWRGDVFGNISTGMKWLTR